MQNLSTANIMDIWLNNGRDAYYIAKEYGVSPWLVYDKLKEYCALNNLDYQEQLRHPERAHKTYTRKSLKSKSTDIINAKLSETDSELDFIIELLKTSKADDIEDIITSSQMLIDIIKNIGGMTDVLY